MRGFSKGFTIIEVMLFLGVSGLLLLMVFIGTGSMASRQRFTDSTDNLQAYFMSEIDQVINGVNTRPSSADCASEGSTMAGGSGGCLLLGRLLVLKAANNGFDSYYVISTGTLSGAETTDIQKLTAADVSVVSTASSSYDIRWGATVSSASRSGAAPRPPVNSIALLRIPDSGRIVTLYYSSVAGLTTGLKTAIGTAAAYNPVSTATSPALAVCLKNDNDFLPATNTRSAVFFGQGASSAVITTNYTPGGSLCP